MANECHGPVVIQDPAGEWLLFHQGGGPDGKSVFMLHSPKPEGPWTAAKTNPGTCGMPTAAYHPNGTLFVVCGNGHELVSASKWDSEWNTVTRLSTPPKWEVSEFLVHVAVEMHTNS